MPVYNGEQFLAESVESLLNQTYKNFELIIINDASTDNSEGIVKTLQQKDSRIKLINNKFEKGISGGLNSGLEIAQGEYIARADSDDINKSLRFEEQIEFLKSHPEVSILGGGYAPFNSERRLEIFHPSNSIELAWKFISNTYFCHPTVMFRKKVYDEIGGYINAKAEDFTYFSKILKKYKGSNLHKILIDYREHETNYSNTFKEPVLENVKKISEENFIYYNGSTNGYSQFIRFQTTKKLSPRDLFYLISINNRIIEKIRNDYKDSVLNLNYLFFRFNILFKLVIGIF